MYLNISKLVYRFGSDGYIDIAVKDFNYWHKGTIDLSKIGFFVTTSEAEAQLEVDLAQVFESASIVALLCSSFMCKII